MTDVTIWNQASEKMKSETDVYSKKLAEIENWKFNVEHNDRCKNLISSIPKLESETGVEQN